MTQDLNSHDFLQVSHQKCGLTTRKSWSIIPHADSRYCTFCCYIIMGCRSTVGLPTLDRPIGVRIPAPQPRRGYVCLSVFVFLLAQNPAFPGMLDYKREERVLYVLY